METDFMILGIVVTYNGSSFIRHCLDRLIPNIDPAGIIVIDNGSSDDTVRIVEEGYKNVTLIKLDRNYGFGKANNIGLKMALDQNAEYVFLLNQDVYMEDFAIKRLVEIARRHPDYAILSPMQLNGRGDALDKHFADYVSSMLISDFYLGTNQELYACPFINAAAWLLSKKGLERIGGFDPLFFHYGEDDDYVNRIRYHKMEIGVCPEVRIRHDRGTQNALSTYPEVRKIAVEVLKTLKNINIPFYQVFKTVLVGWLSEMTAGILLLRYQRVYILLRVFFKVLFRLQRIRRARRESRGRCAFLKDGHRLAAYRPSLYRS